MVSVTFEETGEEREITQVCARCQKAWWGQSELTAEDCGIVSPRGFGHAGADYGFTLCGIDATGDKWWHRL